MADLLEIQQTYRPEQEPDYYFSFGTFQAQAVQQVLEKAVEMGDLSRTGILEAMNSLDKLTFNGMIGDYGYGPPEDREPPRQSTVFKINMEKPFGLEAVKVNFSTDAAAKFPIEKQDI
jgi:hypothetical protein